MENDKILLALGRLEGKMDALITNGRQQSEATREHDTRLRKLETSKAALVGICSVAAFVISMAVSSFSQ
jgi:hypothetical protein